MKLKIHTDIRILDYPPSPILQCLNTHKGQNAGLVTVAGL